VSDEYIVPERIQSACITRLHDVGALVLASGVNSPPRDYGLLGIDAERAVATGLAAAKWYHTNTLIVGRDPEIVAMRPARVLRMTANFLALHDAPSGWWRMLVNASGRLNAEETSYIPPRDHPKVIRTARIWMAVYAAVIALALSSGSWLPLMLVGLPRLYGAWHHVITGILQHAGLDEDVLDHRLNSRTVYMNPISRFIYWNMNYHVEHHMFPMVPYHRLPVLHEQLKNDLPAPNTSILDAWREVVRALYEQHRDPGHRLVRALPANAQPYRSDLHAAALGEVANNAECASPGTTSQVTAA